MPDDREVLCPKCGEAADTFYVDGLGLIVGCDRCLTPMAWDEVVGYDD